MASKGSSFANEDRRGHRGATVDIPFLVLVLLLLVVGLTMLYSASYAQSEYDTGYEISTRYLQKQAVCAVIGLAAMWAFSRIPAQVWYHTAWPLYPAPQRNIAQPNIIRKSLPKRRWRKMQRNGLPIVILKKNQPDRSQDFGRKHPARIQRRWKIQKPDFGRKHQAQQPIRWKSQKQSFGQIKAVPLVIR